jgi:hypothetical protein
MTPQRPVLLIVVVALSLLGNAALGGLYYLRGVDLQMSQEEIAGLQGDREILMRLIPIVRPGISSAELAAAIRSQYPGELVNLGGAQIQWRLFHFQFNDAGKLVDVRWSS